LRFRVEGLGLMVEGFGPCVWSLGCAGLRVEASGFRTLCVESGVLSASAAAASADAVEYNGISARKRSAVDVARGRRRGEGGGGKGER
jgi:hypothetical protein